MATNGMTINGLNPLSALTADDKIPVWDTGASGEPTKEITAQNMANSVKSLANLPNTTEMNTAIAQSTANIDIYSINGNILYAQKIGRLVILTIYDFKVSADYTVTLKDGYKPRLVLNAVVASKDTSPYVGTITIQTNGVLTVNFSNYHALYYGIVAYFV